MSAIAFYFDFTSPYAYLAHFRLPEIASRQGCTIDYVPIDLKAAKLAIGNDGPPNVQLPIKMRYIFSDLMRWAERYGAPFNVGKDASFASERANIGALYAKERGQAGEYVTAVWKASFGLGGSLGSDDLLRGVASELGWEPDALLAFIDSPEARETWDTANKEAQARGVFGVPTMIVDNKMWWGNDRLDFLDDYLANGEA